MPRLNRKRKYNGKSRFSKKGRFGKRRSVKKKSIVRPRTIVSTGVGFPKKMLMTHKYSEAFNITSTTGALATYAFRANGMYDPNQTGTGHQPMYFDQMSALYDHYVVIGAKAVFKGVVSTAGNVAGRLSCFVNDDTSVTASTIDTIAEQTQGKSVTMIGPSTDKQFTKTLKWSAKKYFGGSIMSNPELQGTSAAVPTEESHFVFNLQGDGAGTIALAGQIHITYIAIWKELKDLGSS